MKRTTLALLVGVSLLVVYACGEDETVMRPRTVAVETLTIEQVRESALAAIAAPGQVFHLTSAFDRSQDGQDTEAWIDVERDLARVESPGQIAVVYERRLATVLDGRFYDGTIDSPADKVAPFQLNHLRWLFDEEADVDAIEEGVVDGEPAINVRITRDMYDYDARETNEISLSEGFLPLRARHSTTAPGFPDATSSYTHEFVPRESLPEAFFSPETVQAMTTPLVEHLREARAAGVPPYWLGAEFEETVLRDETEFYEEGELGGTPFLALSYGAPGELPAPSPCIKINAYSREGWDDRIERVRDEFPDSPLLREPDDTVETALGTAQIFVGPAPPAFPTPRFGQPRGTPEPGATVSPGPASLPVVPEDAGAPLEARLTVEGGVVEVLTNCGPSGSNIYRTRAAFERVLHGLRLFEQ